MNFKNKNGLKSSLWGPTIWNTLHILSLGYPIQPTTKQKKTYRNLLKSLKYILPCKKCRTNIKKNLKKIDYKNEIHYKNRKNFVHLIYHLHNMVNEKTGRQIEGFSKIEELEKKLRTI
jgi:hypothetical protein